MHLRLFRLAFILAGAAALAACEGTVGSVQDTESGSESTTTTGSASTSGAGDDSISGAATTADTADTNGADTTPTTGGFAGHPLDNPAGTLSVRTIYFEFDSSDIPESEHTTIAAHARYLSEHAGASLVLEGHADERGSREYNIALGERRAGAVRKLMTLLGGTDPQVRTISYGEERPAADGHDESAWRLNRRVEIVYRVRE